MLNLEDSKHHEIWTKKQICVLYICVCVCVCVMPPELHTHTHTHTHTWRHRDGHLRGHPARGIEQWNNVTTPPETKVSRIELGVVTFALNLVNILEKFLFFVCGEAEMDGFVGE